MPWINTTNITKEEPSEEKPKAIWGIDFDGTICENDFPYIGKPNPGAIEVLRELMEKGYRLILLTMREGDKLQEALAYCNKNYVDFFGVNENPEQKEWAPNSRKVYATQYIDDCNTGIPLIMGSNNKPMVDWIKLRELLVSWDVLDALKPGDGTQSYEIK